MVLRRFALTLATLLPAAAALAQPANNNCSSAINLSLGAPSASGTTANATTDGPAACGDIGADVWYRWTAPAGPSRSMAVDTCGSNFDTVLVVYQAGACPVTAAQQLACDDDGAACGTSPFRQSRVAFTTTPGATYYFRVGGFGGATGNVMVNLGPINDSCAGAIPVNTGTFTGSNVGAQINGNLVCGSIGSDLWYSWTAPSNAGTTIINTCGSNFDTVLAVYNAGTCPVTDAQNVACSDDNGTCGSTLSQVTFVAVAGQSYLIRIGGFQLNAGNFQVNIFNTACFDSQPTIQGTPMTCGSGSTTLVIPAPLYGSYEWRVDGLPFANTRTVSFGPFTPGTRRVECIVTSTGCGAYTTPPIMLVTTAGPQITATSGGGLFCGSSGFLSTLGVTATGPDLTYQWFIGANPLSGETNPTIDIAFSSSVSYFCRVTNPCGSVDSAPIDVTVSPFVAIAPLPATLSVCAGQTLSLTANATNAVSFQWQRNGVDIQGATSATLTRPNMTAALGGTYRCVGTNACGPVNSSDCIVTVQSPIVITGTMPNVTLCEGPMVTFTVPFTGSSPTAVWRRNGQIIQGATNTSLTVTASAATAGEYQCTLTNLCGPVGANAFLFTVRPATAITQQPPTTSTFCFASTGSIGVMAQGHQLTFQWRRNGQNLADGPLPGGTMVSGSQSSTLTFSNVQFEGLSEYQCIVIGTCAPIIVNSDAVAVTLGGPVITVGPGQAFTAIQPAVNSLNNCGKILVMPGTYNERVNIGGKRVWLESTGGPTVTTINGGNSDDPVASTIASIFTSADDAAQVIKGFTITGGRGFTNGNRRFGGGVVFLLPDNATTTPLIENCIIEGNAATAGGGLYAQGLTPVRLLNTIVRNNQVVAIPGVDAFGGGLMASAGAIHADRCTIRGNSASGGSGGFGGGVYFQNTSVPSQFTNCIIEGNSAGFVGGGVRFVNAPVSIINSTFTSNSAGIGAEMHLAFAQTNVTVSNSIIRSTAPDSISAAASPVLTINRSSIPPGTTGFTGSNNITADPLFVSSTDFRLAPGSPCIDAGDNTLLPAGLTIDLAGLPRLADDPGAPNTGTTGNGGSAIVDMGAHERSTTPSDTCADAPTLLAGSYPFTTIGTSTDGPDEGSFAPCGDPRLINDVWFRYTATCSGNTSVSLCGSDFDTLLGIYRGSACPTTPGSIVGCNDDSSCGLQSEVTLAVTTGEVLLIRIAGFNGASGSGTVTIACAPTQPTCRIDFNNDGFVEPGDLDDFITAFFSDDEDERNRCDFTSDGIVEPGDLDEFITAFFEGC